jgi:hypothetical protein
MGGLLGGPKMPPMPKIKPPKMPETPRMPVETDPDIERRAKIRRNATLYFRKTHGELRRGRLAAVPEKTIRASQRANRKGDYNG